MAPDAVVLRTAEELGTENCHCWSQIVSFISKIRLLGCLLGTLGDAARGAH
jgi:hypothetical protein